MAPVTIIPATFIKISSTRHPNGERLVCGIRLVGSEGIGECYRVTKANVATLLGQTRTLGKDDSITGTINDDGSITVDVSEADVGGGGSTCAARTYVFAGAFPAFSGGSGSTVDTVLRNALKAASNSIITALANLVKSI